MRFFRVCAFTLLVASSCFANTANTVNTRICGLKSGAGLITYQDSVLEVHDQVSPILSTGLTDLYSLPEVQGWIRVSKPSRLCLTAVALSKNIYQYDEILAVLDLWDAFGKEWVTPMIFQTASVQAHENIGPKPWVGLSRKDFAAAVAHALGNVQYQDAGALQGPEFSPLQYFSTMLGTPVAAASPDPESRGYVLVPGVDSVWTTYLVTQLRTLNTGNPFTSEVLTDLGVVQVQEASHQVRWAAVPGFFDLYTRLEDLQSGARPSTDSPELRLATLRELSR